MLDHKVVLAMAIKSEWCAASEFNLNLAHAALKYTPKTASWLFVPLFGSAMGQEALFPYFPLNDREIQNLILRIRPYLPRVQWTWQRTGAAFCNRFRGYYFDGGIQDQIRFAIANFDAGGDRLITSIDALGSRMAGQAIRQLEGQWRLMNDVGRH